MRPDLFTSTVGWLTAQVQKYLIDFTERNSFVRLASGDLAIDQTSPIGVAAERHHSKRHIAGCKNPASSTEIEYYVYR